MRRMIPVAAAAALMLAAAGCGGGGIQEGMAKETSGPDPVAQKQIEDMGKNMMKGAKGFPARK